jgi:beta-glucanase (GH16 family)
MAASNQLRSFSGSQASCPAAANGRRTGKLYLLFSLFAVLLTWQGKPCQAQLQWKYNAFDEFNGASGDDVNSSIWKPINNIPQNIWDPNSSDSVTYCARGSVANACQTGVNNYTLDGLGHLVIHAVNTNTTRTVKNAAGVLTPEPVYNSARLESVNDAAHQFQYGRIEARIQVPKGQGAWPAFWLLGSNTTKP